MTVYCTEHNSNNTSKFYNPHVTFLQLNNHSLMLYSCFYKSRNSVLDSCKVADIIVPIVTHDDNGELMYVYSIHDTCYILCICIYQSLLSR